MKITKRRAHNFSSILVICCWGWCAQRLTVIHAQSPVECVSGLTEADQDGNHAIDWTEYQIMLLKFAWSHHEECRPILNVTLLQSHFDESSCSCSEYQPRVDVTETPPCLCFDVNATIAVPRTYPLDYSMTICESTRSILNATCTGHFSNAPVKNDTILNTTADSSNRRDSGPLVASIVVVVVAIGAIAGLAWYRRRKTSVVAFWAHDKQRRRVENKSSTTTSLDSGAKPPEESSFETTETETDYMEEGRRVLTIVEQKGSQSPYFVSFSGRESIPSPPPPQLVEASSSCSSLEAVDGTDSGGSGSNSGGSGSNDSSEDEEQVKNPSAPKRTTHAKRKKASVTKVKEPWDDLELSTKEHITYESSDEDEDSHGPIDVDRVAPLDPVNLDDGYIVKSLTTPRSASCNARGKSMPCHRRKFSAVKTRSAKGVRAAYMEKARTRSSRILKPIPEATLTRAKLIDI